MASEVSAIIFDEIYHQVKIAGLMTSLFHNKDMNEGASHNPWEHRSSLHLSETNKQVACKNSKFMKTRFNHSVKLGKCLHQPNVTSADAGCWLEQEF